MKICIVDSVRINYFTILVRSKQEPAKLETLSVSKYHLVIGEDKGIFYKYPSWSNHSGSDDDIIEICREPVLKLEIYFRPTISSWIFMWIKKCQRNLDKSIVSLVVFWEFRTSHLCPLLEWNAKKSTIKLEVYYSIDADIVNLMRAKA